MSRYELILSWSDADFVAEAPELPGCMAHGGNYEAARSNVQAAISL